MNISGERPIQCIPCKSLFRTTHDLCGHKHSQVHKDNTGIHVTSKGYLCPQCGLSFSRSLSSTRISTKSFKTLKQNFVHVHLS